MNNQFATQFLREELGAYNSLKDTLYDLGADAKAVAILIKGIELGFLTPEKAIEITKQTIGLSEDGAAAPAGGGSTTGGGVTNGATWTSGAGEQTAGKKAFKRVKEDAPRLAGSPAKTNSQGSKNLSAYSKAGFTKAPTAQEAGKKIKGVEVEELWEELLSEANRYSQFKKQAATRSKPEQMHQAAKIIHNKLEEITKLLEFTQQMRSELSEGEDSLEYKHNTKKVFKKINSKVVEVYSKVKSIS